MSGVPAVEEILTLAQVRQTAATIAAVQELFSWRAVAEATAAAYEETIATFKIEHSGREQEENQC